MPTPKSPGGDRRGAAVRYAATAERSSGRPTHGGALDRRQHDAVRAGRAAGAARPRCGDDRAAAGRRSRTIRTRRSAPRRPRSPRARQTDSDPLEILARAADDTLPDEPDPLRRAIVAGRRRGAAAAAAEDRRTCARPRSVRVAGPARRRLGDGARGGARRAGQTRQPARALRSARILRAGARAAAGGFLTALSIVGDASCLEAMARRTCAGRRRQPGGASISRTRSGDRRARGHHPAPRRDQEDRAKWEARISTSCGRASTPSRTRLRPPPALAADALSPRGAAPSSGMLRIVACVSVLICASQAAAPHQGAMTKPGRPSMHRLNAS